VYFGGLQKSEFGPTAEKGGREMRTAPGTWKIVEYDGRVYVHSNAGNVFTAMAISGYRDNAEFAVLAEASK
jgi:hypothetical protein